jgi:hypothetical protein
MATKDAFQRAYKLLYRVTPLAADCGKLCKSRCCTEWEEGVGMYLLPGEEAMYSGDEDWLAWETHSTRDYEFCPTWSGDYYFVKCQGSCPRDKRPFACRTFPLAPHLDTEGNLSMVFDPDGLLICPLVQLGDRKALNPLFIRACEKAWSILIDDDPLIRDDVEYESRKRDSSPGQDYNLFKLLGRTDQ